YSEDTVRRIETFDKLRTDHPMLALNGDSRAVNLRKFLPDQVLFDGIFTSPPYVGGIDYHDQHTYAYELFGITRKDSLEIGPKKGGKSKTAQQKYIEDIGAVFKHACKFLKPDAKIFIVANDRMNLYPEIAKR